MRSSARPTTAVFLDRDDTIIRDPGYLSDPHGIDILPGAAEAIHVLNDSGIPAIIITNQSGIARGLFKEDTLGAIHKRLTTLLAAQGARIDAIYYCPHHPDGIREGYRVTCTCRKPQPGLLLKAAQDFGLDLRLCYLVGDKPIDVETIHKAGGKGILITTGKDMLLTVKPDYSAVTIKDAVNWILKDMMQ
jgi:D-glycero-D-manno-heptose 1,7-bisphosphate phosphatase